MAHFVRSAADLPIVRRACIRQFRTFAATSSEADPPVRPWFLRDIPARDRLPSSVPAVDNPPPPPVDAPEYIATIHRHLSSSPLIIASTLSVGPPQEPPRPPPVDYQPTKGKRKRGRVYAGRGFGEPPGFWKWVVVAQVKEGTEGRGAIESVIRSTRKRLSVLHPDLSLPGKAHREAVDGWGMLDIGDTAVHILSRTAREKWFSQDDQEEEWELRSRPII